MLKLFVNYLVAFSMTFFSVMGSAAPQQGQAPEVVAKASIAMLDRYATIGELLNDIEPFYSAEEISGLKARLQEMNVKLTEKIPKMSAKGSEIGLGQSRLVVTKDGKINFKGTVHEVRGVKLDILFAELTKGFNKPTSSAYSLLIPDANAFDYGAGAATLMKAGIVGIGVAIVLAGVIVAYVSKSEWESIKDGQVSCAADGKFSVRKKVSGKLGVATSKAIILSNEAASSLLSESDLKCNEETLKALTAQAKKLDVRDVENVKTKSEAGRTAN